MYKTHIYKTLMCYKLPKMRKCMLFFHYTFSTCYNSAAVQASQIKHVSLERSAHRARICSYSLHKALSGKQRDQNFGERKHSFIYSSVTYCVCSMKQIYLVLGEKIQR